MMANVVVLGGGFGGVVAAERLADQIGREHQITLVSRTDKFVFYPDLVKLAFGEAEPSDITFDLRDALLNRRIRFIKAEVARLNPQQRKVILAHGEMEGDLSYDYLVFALGRRLATEEVEGFFEHANHLLTVDGALKLSESIRNFHEGRAVIGQCPEARLPVPVYETAFALSRMLSDRGDRARTVITIVSADPPGYQLDDANIAHALRESLEEHAIEYLPDFPINKVSAASVFSSNGHAINYRLLMLLPPFRGPGPVAGPGTTGDDGYINVDDRMRVTGCQGLYAVGDCVNLSGPKMGHMAVHQAEVAAANIAAELRGKEPATHYDHDLMMVIDEGGSGTIFVSKHLDGRDPAVVRQGRFWSWAKWVHDKYWQGRHS